MTLLDAIEKAGHLSTVSVPELRYIQSAAERVRERWPEVQVAKNESEREALAQKLRDCVESDDWEDTRLSFVVSAASAVFDQERRERPDLARTRDFIYAEITASTSETFLSGLMRAYLDSYVPKSSHTSQLATTLGAAAPRMGTGTQLLMEAIPEIMDPASGPDRLAARMSKMSDPYTELLRFGLRNPHGSGFMDISHRSLTALVRPHLSERNLIEWYIKWLRPPGKEDGRTTGAELAIEALIHPWLSNTPEDKLRSFLVETLIELYGDPRIKSGGVWGGIDDRYMAVVHRWLTREDMRFFTGVVDATQDDAMWPPRRDFWLKLYDEGKIDAAWAALSSQAFEYARQHLMRQDAKNAYSRVAYQRARQNTSLLIMKIGNKIMVDGCHSYRTHVFDIADPMAPKLFEEGYDCEQIMRASDRRTSGASKSHSSISSWSRWVRDMINADVPWSQQSRAYEKVFRPQPPRPKDTPPKQREASSRSRHDHSRAGIFGSTYGGDIFSPLKPNKKSSAPPASVAATRRVHKNENHKLGNSRSSNPTLLNQARFPSLTDRMIAYGPPAAAAVLAYLEAPDNGRTRPLVSPKTMEGLEWVHAGKGVPSIHLKDAIEHLLIKLKTSGIDLDALFQSSNDFSSLLNQPVHSVSTQEKPDLSDGQKFPPLPNNAEGRLKLLREHVDALEDLGMWERTFDQRKALSVALRKLRDQSLELRPSEVGELQALYEKLRHGQKGRRK